MNAILAAAAVNGLLALDEFFDARSPGLAFQMRQELRAFVARILLQPHLYGRITRCPAGRDIRHEQLHRFVTRCAVGVGNPDRFDKLMVRR